MYFFTYICWAIPNSMHLANVYFPLYTSATDISYFLLYHKSLNYWSLRKESDFIPSQYDIYLDFVLWNIEILRELNFGH